MRKGGIMNKKCKKTWITLFVIIGITSFNLKANEVFNKNTGTTGYDSSSKENDGTISDVAREDGKCLIGLEFDWGDDDYVNCGTDPRSLL